MNSSQVSTHLNYLKNKIEELTEKVSKIECSQKDIPSTIEKIENFLKHRSKEDNEDELSELRKYWSLSELESMEYTIDDMSLIVRKLNEINSNDDFKTIIKEKPLTIIAEGLNADAYEYYIDERKDRIEPGRTCIFRGNDTHQRFMRLLYILKNAKGLHRIATVDDFSKYFNAVSRLTKVSLYLNNSSMNMINREKLEGNRTTLEEEVCAIVQEVIGKTSLLEKV